MLVDRGRARPDWPLTPIAAAADATLIMSRPYPGDVAHLGAAIQRLRSVAVQPSVLLLGDKPYGPAEVGRALGASVLGVLADDPEGAAGELAMDGALVRWSRSALLRSARAVAANLTWVESPRGDRVNYAGARQPVYPVGVRVGSA